jgi:tetratricopeptide (TPR) repeat protein
VELALPRSASWQGADAVVAYSDDGSVRRIAAGVTVDEHLLVPELTALTERPEDFTSTLQAGVALLDWGWPERAERYLQRAIELGAENPYGYFFLGRARELMGDRTAAKRLYERAVALDKEPRNPAFHEALRKAPS